MDFTQLLFGAFSGDLGALSILFVLMLPIAAIHALAKWVYDNL